MASCAKLTCKTSTPQLKIPIWVSGVSSFFFVRYVSLRLNLFLFPPFKSAHPTLNRHLPLDVVANTKRINPFLSRLPKPRKRDIQGTTSMMPLPRSSGMGPVPLTASVVGPPPSHNLVNGAVGSARGLSAHTLHPLTPSDDPSAIYHSMYYYANSNRDIVVPSQSSYPEENNRSFTSNGSSFSSHNGSLSSLLNPTNGYSARPTPTINTSYGSPFSSIQMQDEHSASSLSPTSVYSISPVSSIPYQDDYSRPS